MYAAARVGGTPRCRSTCHGRIGSMPSGRSSGSSARRLPIGPATAMLTTPILQKRLHPELGLRVSLGTLRLVRSYGRRE